MRTEYCDAEVLRRLRRASLARLRAEVEPVEPRALGRFLPAWHGVQTAPPAIGGAGCGGRRARTTCWAWSSSSPARRCPASAVESLILPARLPGYTPALLDELTAAGEVSWTGCGPLAGSDGWLALAPTDVADLLLPEPEPDTRQHSPAPGRCWRRSTAVAPLFFRQLADAAGRTLIAAGEAAPGDDTVVAAIWDLVWAGLLGNDTLAPLRARLGGSGARGGPAHRGGARPRAAATRRCARVVRRCPAGAGRRRWAGGGRWRPPGSPIRPAGRTPAPRRSSNDTACSPAARWTPSGSPAGSRGSTACCGPWRTPGGPGAATSWRGSARPSSRCPARSTGSARCPARTAAATSDTRLRRIGPGLSRVVLAAADPGPALRRGAGLAGRRSATRSTGRAARRARSSCSSRALRRSTSSGAGGRCCRSAPSAPSWWPPRTRWPARCTRAGSAPLAVERADGVGSLGSELAEVLTEAGFRVTPKGLRLRA